MMVEPVSLSTLLVAAAVVVFSLVTLVWLYSLIQNDVSVIDLFWGLLFVVIAWTTYLLSDFGEPVPRRFWVTLLVTLWGGRLALYLTWRNWGKGEDYRYQEMRASVGPFFRWRSLVTVFWLQAAIAWVVALPVVQAIRATSPAEWTVLDLIGTVLFVIGLLFEAVGDLQLARFKADPANQGKVMDRGLWRFTRHPNYFGDAVVWVGLFCFALATGGWWTVVGPILMTALLMKVSGVALLEKKLAATKPKYRDYVERTNAFFPWWPKPKGS